MNSASNLLVLGATGQVGKLVAKHLKRSKANFSAGSRRKENLKELADQFGASRFIDLDDPRTFDEALKDVTGIFLITGYTVDMLVQSKSLIDAARRNGVKHIFATAALHGRIYIPTCLCRICYRMPRSKVAGSVITLPRLLGTLLWKMWQNPQQSFSWKGRKNTVERTTGFQRMYLLRTRWLKL